MIKVDFSNAKVGDDVLDLREGWEKIVHIDIQSLYPVRTKANCYTFGGRLHRSDKHPTLFPKDQVPTELLKLYGPPPCEFKKGDRVLVSESNCIEFRRYFSHVAKDGRFECFESGMDEWAAKGKTTPWNYCKPWKEGEE